MNDLTEMMTYIIDNNLSDCEVCGKFKHEDDMCDGLCKDCQDIEEVE